MISFSVNNFVLLKESRPSWEVEKPSNGSCPLYEDDLAVGTVTLLNNSQRKI